MVIYFSALLLTALSAGFGMALRPTFRRVLTTTTAPRTSTPEVAAPPVPLTLELPAELQHLPEPPMLEAASVEILQPPEITKRLRQLELGLQDLGPPLPDDHPVVASVLAAISDPATQKRLTPRRPNLLPQPVRVDAGSSGRADGDSRANHAAGSIASFRSLAVATSQRRVERACGRRSVRLPKARCRRSGTYRRLKVQRPPGRGQRSRIAPDGPMVIFRGPERVSQEQRVGLLRNHSTEGR
jgi:hypothetical protein